MRTVWLASYPKSGNTWFRMLVANLSAVDKPVDINKLPEGGGIASSRASFDHRTLIDSSLLTHDEIDGLRPLVYENMAHDEADHDRTGTTSSVRFVKTHDAYTRLPSGEPLLAGARGADGVILIVRDPRDVAPSFANHSSTDVDDAIRRMNEDHDAFCGADTKLNAQLRQHLLGWSGHTKSWLSQRDIPLHLIRYEDLRADTFGIFRGALAFAGQAAADTQIASAVRFSDFTELQRQEVQSGFGESPLQNGKGHFFRRGEAGAWRDELTAEQVARIEAAHAPMMRRLGYEPAQAIRCTRKTPASGEAA